MNISDHRIPEDPNYQEQPTDLVEKQVERAEKLLDIAFNRSVSIHKILQQFHDEVMEIYKEGFIDGVNSTKNENI